jgi:hypothetical protein
MRKFWCLGLCLPYLLSDTGIPGESYAPADSIHTIVQQPMVKQISRQCVLVARNLTNLIYDNVVAGDPALAAWWHNVFCECILRLVMGHA